MIGRAGCGRVGVVVAAERARLGLRVRGGDDGGGDEHTDGGAARALGKAHVGASGEQCQQGQFAHDWCAASCAPNLHPSVSAHLRSTVVRNPDRNVLTSYGRAMRWSATALLLFACAHQPPAPDPADLELHRRALVVDTHSDVTQEMVYHGVDIAKRRPHGHEDLPRMLEGGLDAQFFSIWIDPEAIP